MAVADLAVSLFANICSWGQMNFFNGLRIKKDIEDYYYFSGNDPLFKNLVTLLDNNLGYLVFQAIERTKILLTDAETAGFSCHQMGIDIEESRRMPLLFVIPYIFPSTFYERQLNKLFISFNIANKLDKANIQEQMC